jgi:Zn finger protein HypA/HybF involved in hydrogenase expression
VTDDTDPAEPKLADVHALPVKPRPENVARVLTEVEPYTCQHTRFIINAKLAQVTCEDCQERLDPMQVLVTLSRGETKYHELHARYQDEMRRLGERSRTKCEHCDKMTRISRS